jgi:hypothetical protein
MESAGFSLFCSDLALFFPGLALFYLGLAITILGLADFTFSRHEGPFARKLFRVAIF